MRRWQDCGGFCVKKATRSRAEAESRYGKHNIFEHENYLYDVRRFLAYAKGIPDFHGDLPLLNPPNRGPVAYEAWASMMGFHDWPTQQGPSHWVHWYNFRLTKATLQQLAIQGKTHASAIRRYEEWLEEWSLDGTHSTLHGGFGPLNKYDLDQHPDFEPFWLPNMPAVAYNARFFRYWHELGVKEVHTNTTIDRHYRDYKNYKLTQPEKAAIIREMGCDTPPQVENKKETKKMKTIKRFATIGVAILLIPNMISFADKVGIPTGKIVGYGLQTMGKFATWNSQDFVIAFVLAMGGFSFLKATKRGAAAAWAKRPFQKRK